MSHEEKTRGQRIAYFWALLPVVVAGGRGVVTGGGGVVINGWVVLVGVTESVS